MHWEPSTSTPPSPGELLFIHLENFFRSKGHTAEEATVLADEACEVLEDWYEEKMEGNDD